MRRRRARRLCAIFHLPDASDAQNHLLVGAVAFSFVVMSVSRTANVSRTDIRIESVSVELSNPYFRFECQSTRHSFLVWVSRTFKPILSVRMSVELTFATSLCQSNCQIRRFGSNVSRTDIRL